MRIRLFIVGTLCLLLLLALVLFPEIAAQHLHIKAFGWQFDARQDAFLLAIILLGVILNLLWRSLCLLLFTITGTKNWLVSGSEKHNSNQLRSYFLQTIDMQDIPEKQVQKFLRASQNLLPNSTDWAHDLLSVLQKNAAEQTLPDADADAVHIALAARIATEPHANPKPDLAIRKAFLQAWQKVSPKSPLANNRVIELAEEEGDWQQAVRLLEVAWKSSKKSGTSIQPRLAHAYVLYAPTLPHGRKLDMLKKAHKLAENNIEVILALGEEYIRRGDIKKTTHLWHTCLQQHDSIIIAKRLLAICPEPLKLYRLLESESASNKSAAWQWLRANLAHIAGLEGLAKQHMQDLMVNHQFDAALLTQAEWYAEKEDWQNAAAYYKQVSQRYSQNILK
ncbi:MAG: hypothetical protein R8K21_06675 [Mariprofundales bacterium]